MLKALKRWKCQRVQERGGVLCPTGDIRSSLKVSCGGAPEPTILQGREPRGRKCSSRGAPSQRRARSNVTWPSGVSSVVIKSHRAGKENIIDGGLLSPHFLCGMVLKSFILHFTGAGGILNRVANQG